MQIRGATAGHGAMRVLAVVVLFELMIVLPVALYFYLAHSDWCWMYLLDPARLPRGSGVLVFAGYAAALLGGYGAGYTLVRRDRLRALYGAVALTIVAHCVVGVAWHERLLASSTFAGYPAQAVNILRVRLGYVLPATAAGVLAAFAFAVWQLWVQGRRQAS